MLYSHQLTYSLFVDSIEEFSTTFYGSSLEMQELELVLDGTLQPLTVYQQQVKEFLSSLFSAYEGKLEYIIELSYNQKLVKKEEKEEHYEL